jgi:hypothetical protein
MEDLYKNLKSDYVSVVGNLVNLMVASESDQKYYEKNSKKFDYLKNAYIGEVKSLTDDNLIPILLIEEEFCALTSILLSSSYVVIIKNARRVLSNNLEIYLETVITNENLMILGKEGIIHDANTINDKEYSMINFISPEIITRNRLLINGRVSDINFIKFEFVCQLCKGGTMVSIAKCINSCKNPRPLMKIFMRCTIQDDNGSEAYISLSDDRCCKVFSIDLSNIDIFKEYFFQHGVFYYKSMQKFNAEYGNVIAFFKNANSQRKFVFEVIPFCKIGYEE